MTPGIRDFFSPTPPKPRKESQRTGHTLSKAAQEAQHGPPVANEDAMEEEGTQEQSTRSPAEGNGEGENESGDEEMHEAADKDDQGKEDQPDENQDEQPNEEQTEGSEEETEETDDEQETAEAEGPKCSLPPLPTLNSGKFRRAYSKETGEVPATPTAASIKSNASHAQLVSASSSVITPSTLGASSVTSTLRSSRYAGVAHGAVPVNDTPEELQPLSLIHI